MGYVMCYVEITRRQPQLQGMSAGVPVAAVSIECLYHDESKMNQSESSEDMMHKLKRPLFSNTQTPMLTARFAQFQQSWLACCCGTRRNLNPTTKN